VSLTFEGAKQAFRLPLRLSAERAPVAILAIGIIGLPDDSWLRRGISAFINLHALFGTWLVAFVMLRAHLRMRLLPRPQPVATLSSGPIPKNSPSMWGENMNVRKGSI